MLLLPFGNFMKKTLAILIFLLLWTVRWWSTQNTLRFENQQPTTSKADIAQIAEQENPASIYCEQQWWILKIITDEEWIESGHCTLPDGKEGNPKETKTYTSSLGFSLELPGACSDKMIFNEGQPTQYLPLENLDITNTNGHKEIWCFFPSFNTPEKTIHIGIRSYPCDMEGSFVMIGENSLEVTETPPWLGLDEGKRCYKANLNTGSIYITFTQKEYKESIMQSLRIQDHSLTTP